MEVVDEWVLPTLFHWGTSPSQMPPACQVWGLPDPMVRDPEQLDAVWEQMVIEMQQAPILHSASVQQSAEVWIPQLLLAHNDICLPVYYALDLYRHVYIWDMTRKSGDTHRCRVRRQ